MGCQGRDAIAFQYASDDSDSEADNNEDSEDADNSSEGGDSDDDRR